MSDKKNTTLTTTQNDKQFTIELTPEEVLAIVTKTVESRVKALASKSNPLSAGNYAWAELKSRNTSNSGWAAYFEAAGLPKTLKGSADRTKAQCDAIITAMKGAGLDDAAIKKAVTNSLGDLSKAAWKPVLLAFLFPEAE